MLELPMRFLPSIAVETRFQDRFLSTGPGAIHMGWTRGCE